MYVQFYVAVLCTLLAASNHVMVMALDSEVSEAIKNLESNISRNSQDIADDRESIKGVVLAIALVKSRFQNRLEYLQSQVDQFSAILATYPSMQKYRRPKPVYKNLTKSAGRRDCSDVAAGSHSGLYRLSVTKDRDAEAYCDMETDGGGWTVVQRRDVLAAGPHPSFNRTYINYVKGFGKTSGEHWWGLENMHLLTAQSDRQYELRFDLEDFKSNKAYAVYTDVKVGNASQGFFITYKSYKGNAGDSLSHHRNSKFSTVDRDQDNAETLSCAAEHASGWWFNGCATSNLNAPFEGRSYANGKISGMRWDAWKGSGYFLKKSEMKLRPMNFKAKTK